jgi:type I restriction enzyme S subunit
MTKYTDCAEIISGGTPKTSIPEYWNGDIPWLSVVDFNTGDKYVYATEKTITQDGLDNSSTKLLQKNDIIISARGTVGAMAMLPFPMAFNQSCFGIRAKKEIVDADYLFYATKCKIEELKQKSKTGNVFKSINLDTFEMLELNLPSLKEQKKIAATLSTLDDKISLNEQINRNLEELARLIYDYWFVQFDFPDKNGKPYKSSGGKMVWNEKLKRDIPAGWQTARVRDVILPIERGISYSSDEITDPNGTPMINLACFDKKGNYRTGEFKYFTGKFKNEDKVYPYDMLIACTDLTQKADIIGTPIFAPTESPFYVFSMDLIKISPIRSSDKQFLYYYLKHPAFHHYIKPFASGTTVKHLRVDGLLDYPIFLPDEKIRDVFADVMEPIRRKIADNSSQCVELSKMRDYLLPLLMNGQVSVKSSGRSK